MAAVLIAALGWPSTAGATSGVGPEAEVPTKPAEPEPEAAKPEPEQPSAPTPTRELTPEEIERLGAEQLQKEATQRWQEGRLLYENERYAEAAREFELSYAAVPAA